MKATLRRFRIIAVLFLTWQPTSTLADSIEPEIFLQLPRHCQAWFAQAKAAGKFEGSKAGMRRYEANLREMLGAAAVSLNHYCPGLANLIKLESQQLKYLERREKLRRLNDIMEDMDYQLRAPYTDATRWFQAEVIKNKAYVFRLMEKNKDAISHFEKAIEVFPPYLPAYWELSKVYEALGDYQAAVGALKTAQQFAKKESYQNRISQRIHEVEAAMAKAQAKSRDQPDDATDVGTNGSLSGG